jgi:hypothetical protein
LAKKGFIGEYVPYSFLRKLKIFIFLGIWISAVGI